MDPNDRLQAMVNEIQQFDAGLSNLDTVIQQMEAMLGNVPEGADPEAVQVLQDSLEAAQAARQKRDDGSLLGNLLESLRDQEE